MDELYEKVDTDNGWDPAHALFVYFSKQWIFVWWADTTVL